MEARNGPADDAGIMDKVKRGATSQLNTQKDRATEGIGSVVQAVRQSTQHLRENHHETIAQYVDQAAGQLERLSNRLREKNAGELLQDAQDLARRRPAVFIGSAFAIGLLGARFLKSSRDRRAWNSGGQRVPGIRGGDYPRDRTVGPAVTPTFDTGRL